MKWTAALLVLKVTVASSLVAADAPLQGAVTNAPVKQLSRDVFQVGEVQLDKAARTVSFPARVNMNEGPVEYLLVSTSGKTHESVLLTDAEPYHIHVAMLLLGAKGAPPTPPEQRTTATNKIAGEQITIEVEWAAKGEKKTAGGEELIFNLETKSPMSRGHWVYNGSWIFDGTFLAQRERSVVAIIHDYDSLVNNPRPGRENDELWRARNGFLPAVGTPVQVKMKLQPPSAASGK